jgi:hypothetical protein
MIEMSVRAGCSHLIPGYDPPKPIVYDNSEWTSTTSSSTSYTFKVMNVNETPEVIMVDIPIKTGKENDDDYLPF